MMKHIRFSGNQLKTIAVIAMFLDHLAWWLLPVQSIGGQLTHALGRIVAPIMCYFISEGYFYTSNVKKYLGRLLVFAVISHFPYVLYFGYSFYKTTSVIWTLSMGLLALWLVKREQVSDWLKFAGVVGCCLLAYFSDWSYLPVLWIVCFSLYRGDFKKQMIGFSAVGCFCYLLPNCLAYGWQSFYRFGIFLAVPLLWLYHGERGGKGFWQKWVFYFFYPLHLLLLYFLRCLV